VRRFSALLCAVVLIGCASLPQRIASAAAVVSVTTARTNIAWWNEQATTSLDRVASEGGGIADWCEAVSEAHQTAQRVTCAADALADLAVAGQQLVDAGADSGSTWTAWLSGVPPVLDALESAFAAADYHPPATLTAALGALRALIGVIAPGGPAPPPCEVTQYPAECAQSHEAGAAEGP
jgi:hypothetical protein